MHNVIINGRFFTRRITGVERFAREIVTALDGIAEPGKIILACPPETKDIPKYRNIEVVKIGRLHNQLWEHISFPLYVMKNRSVSLNLCNVAPLLSPGIVCIHDMKVRATPQFFSKKFLSWYRLLFFNATKRAKKILTVSEFSKREIIRFYKVNPDKIVVVPNGCQHMDRIAYDEDALVKYGLRKDSFFFSMCSLEPNKNFKWIAEFAQRNPAMIFAVAGSINKKVFKDGLGFECPQNVRLLGYISDSEAKTLMRDCYAFLFPSFYEGFGIPPLEAACVGAKRIVVSDIPVMHEIFGDCAIYIDPFRFDCEFSFRSCVFSSIMNKYSWLDSAKCCLANIVQF